jgi:mannose-6-phosphate isomerase-like protein (cupin superfamily)
MSLTESFVVRRDAGEAGPWQVLAGGDRTAGSVIFGEARLPARSPGPGLHVHTREDEAAYVISGVLTFVVGDQRFEASAGELVWLPREVPHAFANLGDEPVGPAVRSPPRRGLRGCSRNRARTSPAYEVRRTQTGSVRSALVTGCARWDRRLVPIEESPDPNSRHAQQAALWRTSASPRSRRPPLARLALCIMGTESSDRLLRAIDA